jgi:hypothetical protein
VPWYLHSGGQSRKKGEYAVITRDSSYPHFLPAIAGVFSFVSRVRNRTQCSLRKQG